jgi:DNA-binding MarR family transcriptional regulator
MIDQSSDDLGLLLGLAWVAYTDALHHRLTEKGFGDIRSPDGVLFRLLHHRKSMTVMEIAELLGVTKQAASQAVDLLEQRGYASRAQSPTDRRERLVSLTKQGAAARRAAIAIAGETERSLRTAIGTTSYEGFVAALHQLIVQEDDVSSLVSAAREMLVPTRLQ